MNEKYLRQQVSLIETVIKVLNNEALDEVEKNRTATLLLNQFSIHALLEGRFPNVDLVTVMLKIAGEK